MNKLLVSYAMDFSGFLMQNLDKKYLPYINQIILFGSVARGDATNKSDVDIFINTTKKLEFKCKRISAEFYESEIYKRYWRLIGVKNEIKLIVDELKNWPDLRMSIIADGIILYGKYAASVKTKDNYVILWWGSIKPEYKRVMISKQLYGWKLRKKVYRGMIQKADGEKLGSNVILVPSQNFDTIKEFFRKHKINYKSMYISAIK